MAPVVSPVVAAEASGQELETVEDREGEEVLIVDLSVLETLSSKLNLDLLGAYYALCRFGSKEHVVSAPVLSLRGNLNMSQSKFYRIVNALQNLHLIDIKKAHTGNGWQNLYTLRVRACIVDEEMFDRLALLMSLRVMDGLLKAGSVDLVGFYLSLRKFADGPSWNPLDPVYITESVTGLRFRMGMTTGRFYSKAEALWQTGMLDVSTGSWGRNHYTVHVVPPYEGAVRPVRSGSFRRPKQSRKQAGMFLRSTPISKRSDRPNDAANQAVREELLAKQEYRCGYCRKGQQRLALEHIVPRNPERGPQGSDERRNLVMVCKECNESKTNLQPLTWLRQLILSSDPLDRIRAINLISLLDERGIFAVPYAQVELDTTDGKKVSLAKPSGD